MSAKTQERQYADSQANIENNPVEEFCLDRVIFCPFLPDLRCPTQISGLPVEYA